MPILRNTETLINVDDINMLTNLYNIFYVTHVAQCWLTPNSTAECGEMIYFSIFDS